MRSRRGPDEHGTPAETSSLNVANARALDTDPHPHGLVMTERVVRIGVVTPHAAAGPVAEFPAMAPWRITTRLARIATDAAGLPVGTGRPARTAARALTEPPLLDDAAAALAADPVDVIGFASTSCAYAIGFDDEAALTERLTARIGIPVASTCASAVLALRILQVGRVALVEPPWFDDELNALGATYFRNQGIDVVSAACAELPRDPGRIDPAGVYEWTSRHVPADAEAVSSEGTAFERRPQSSRWK